MDDLAKRLDPGDGASEHYHQAYFVSWFRKTRPNDTLFAIPNGGHRGKGQATKLRAEGVLAGVWDLFWLDQMTWIEMKTPKGKLSQSQIEFGKRAEAAGYKLIVGYGFSDAVTQIEGGKREWQKK